MISNPRLLFTARERIARYAPVGRMSHPLDSLMAMDMGLVIALVGVGGTAFGALVGSWATAGLSARNARKAESRATVRSSAKELIAALGVVRAVTRRSLPVNSIDGDDVSAAVTSWGDAVMRREAQLPPSARHVGRSVVDALAEHVGIAARAHHDARWGSLPLGEITEDGRETVIAYIDYVGAWISRSEQKGTWPPGLKRYHEWVREYERRRSEPMPSRLDWILHRLPSERPAS